MSNKTNFSINFYEVLGVEATASLKEIKKQYSKLVVKYHPDKTKDSYDTSIFELIQRAYNTLGNEEKREEYDFFMKNIELSKKNDHKGLKTNFDKFVELNENETQNKNKEELKVEFDKVFKEMDIKVGIDRTQPDETLNNEEIANKLDDLVLQREQDEIEYSQNRIFRDGENFDLSKFNAAFDVYKNTNDKQVIKKSNINAFNFDKGNNFSTLDNENLFEEDNFEGNNVFSNINIGKTNKLDKEKIKNLSSVDYTLNHNNKDVSYETELKKRLEERDRETQEIQNLKYNDFNNEDKVFQFSHEVGLTENMLDFVEEGNDLLNACKKLIELEKK